MGVELARELAEATIPVQVGLSNPEFEQKVASTISVDGSKKAPEGWQSACELGCVFIVSKVL